MTSNFSTQPDDAECPGYAIPNEYSKQLDDETTNPSFSNYSDDEVFFDDDAADLDERLDHTEANEAANYTEYDHLLAQFERPHMDDVMDDQDDQIESDLEDRPENDLDDQTEMDQANIKGRCNTACEAACTCPLTLVIVACLAVAIITAALGATNNPVPTSTSTHTGSERVYPGAGPNAFAVCLITCSGNVNMDMFMVTEFRK